MKKYSLTSPAWGLARIISGARPALHGTRINGLAVPVLFPSREDARVFRRNMEAPNCYRVVRVSSVFTWTV